MSEKLYLSAFKGTLSLMGPLVDTIANKWIAASDDPKFQETVQSQRKVLLSEDPNSTVPHYHITAFSPKERKATQVVWPTALPSNITQHKQVLFDLGIGMVKQGQDRMYYVVIICPFLNNLRAQYGLPAVDLHITLGTHHFHDEPKGMQT